MSKYMGFISGYKARNIASMEETIQTHIESLREVLKKIKSRTKNVDLKKKVERTVSLLDDLDQYNTLDKFLSVINLYRSYAGLLSDENLNDLSLAFLMEFGLLVETLDDSQLRERVYEIGQELNLDN